MGKRVFLLALLVSAAVARAGPVTCVTQTLDQYEQLGGAGCTIGNLTVKAFSYSSAGDVTIPASAITVEPYSDPHGPRLRFSSDAFSVGVGAGQQAVLELVYNIDPPPVIIRGFDEEMFAETPVSPGFVTIDTWLCVGGTFPGCGGLPLFLQLAHYGLGDPTNILTDSIWFPPSPPAYILGVSHTITLNGGGGGGGGSASFNALENLAYTVPEPAAWLLVGCGLLALPFLRRRSA